MADSIGDFIRSGDTRIRRVKKQEGGGFFYYHALHEGAVNIELLSKEDPSEETKTRKATPTAKEGRSDKKTYDERSLHMLLSTFLWNAGIYSKTIFHEQSAYAVDGNQTWTHPDMVAIRFLKLHTKESQNFLKVVNRVDTFKISSYEIKKEINTDSDLKKAFFQAVSNSSWANYGYLVAFEISDSLKDEMERLNQSFGIGVVSFPEVRPVITGGEGNLGPAGPRFPSAGQGLPSTDRSHEKEQVHRTPGRRHPQAA